MSHFTKIKTKLSNLDHLKKALTRMGYTYELGNFKITEYGTTEKAEVLLDKSLGLSLQEDGTYAFVGDPYHCRTQKLNNYYGQLDRLESELSTAYAVEETTYNLEQQNYFCTENAEAKIGDDNLIHMCFESYS